jgi:hypothetical protein
MSDRWDGNHGGVSMSDQLANVSPDRAIKARQPLRICIDDSGEHGAGQIAQNADVIATE